MKFAVLALLGVVSTKQVQTLKDKINALRITVAPGGGQRIEAAGNALHEVAESIKNSRPVRNLGSSLEQWGQSPEAQRLQRYDQRFWNSAEGRRLATEWRDVGEALQEHVHETPNGVAIDNGGLQDVGDELEDVGQQYHELDGSHWDHGYETRWNAAASNRQAGSVSRRFNSFKHSSQGQAFGQALQHFGQTVDQNVQVTDIPPEWQQLDNKLRIDVHNAQEIERDANRVARTWHTIEESQPVRNLGSSIQRWIQSPEVQRYHQLEQEFLATPKGQNMRREWEDVFHALDEVVDETPNGISIDNSRMPLLEDEIHDVGQEYEDLARSPWQARFERRGAAAVNNQQAQVVQQNGEAFKRSAEGRALKRSVRRFGQTLDRNVEVSDVPASWQQDMFLF